MALDATRIFSRINRKIHNAKDELGGDDELFDILNEAGRDMQLEIDLISLKRDAQPFLCYPNVYEYPLPQDIAYDKTIYIKKTKDLKGDYNRTEPRRLFDRRNPLGDQWWNDQNFDVHTLQQTEITGQNAYAVEFEDTKPYLLLKSTTQGNQVGINLANDLTANGTWVASDDATNLRVNTQQFVNSASSLSFDSLGGGISLTVSNSTMTPQDLTSYKDQGRLFVSVLLPATLPNTITLRWGSDASNYWEKQLTRQNGLPFHSNWNLLSVDWVGATKVNNPDITKVNFLYLNMQMTVPSVQYNFGINGFFVRLGEQMDLKYYTKLTVKDYLTGVNKENFVDNRDESLLQEQEINLLILKAAAKAAAQLREFSAEYQTILNEYSNALMAYMQKHPSQTELQSIDYYIC